MDLARLDTTAREEVGNNLTLATAPDDFKATEQLEASDFLVRGIIGMDPHHGAIAVGDAVRVGQRFRFMVRLCLCTMLYRFLVTSTIGIDLHHRVVANGMQCGLGSA